MTHESLNHLECTSGRAYKEFAFRLQEKFQLRCPKLLKTTVWGKGRDS